MLIDLLCIIGILEGRSLSERITTPAKMGNTQPTTERNAAGIISPHKPPIEDSLGTTNQAVPRERRIRRMPRPCAGFENKEVRIISNQGMVFAPCEKCGLVAEYILRGVLWEATDEKAEPWLLIPYKNGTRCALKTRHDTFASPVRGGWIGNEEATGVFMYLEDPRKENGRGLWKIRRLSGFYTIQSKENKYLSSAMDSVSKGTKTSVPAGTKDAPPYIMVVADSPTVGEDEQWQIVEVKRKSRR